MELWQAVFLGILQGLTEFLPVSSSGHLVLAQTLIGIPENLVVSFDIIVHLGTLLAVLCYFYQDLKQLISGILKREKPSLRLFVALILGTIPVVVVYFLIHDWVERLFNNPLTTSFCLALTGFILLISDRLGGDRRLDEIKPIDAVWIGIGQAIAVMPGISRSGSTIAAGLWRKMSRQGAARFSFLLSIPVILGAGATDLGNLVGGGYRLIGPVCFWTGLVCSGVTGYLVIKYFLAYLQRGTLKGFAYYCMLAGGFALTALLLR